MRREKEEDEEGEIRGWGSPCLASLRRGWMPYGRI